MAQPRAGAVQGDKPRLSSPTVFSMRVIVTGVRRAAWFVLLLARSAMRQRVMPAPHVTRCPVSGSRRRRPLCHPSSVTRHPPDVTTCHRVDSGSVPASVRPPCPSQPPAGCGATVTCS